MSIAQHLADWALDDQAQGTHQQLTTIKPTRNSNYKWIRRPTRHFPRDTYQGHVLGRAALFAIRTMHTYQVLYKRYPSFIFTHVHSFLSL